MSREDRAALLKAALELWTHYGPKRLDLVVRGQEGLADLTVVRARPRRTQALKSRPPSRTDRCSRPRHRPARPAYRPYTPSCSSPTAVDHIPYGDPDPHEREHQDP